MMRRVLTNYPCTIGIATSDAGDVSINAVQNKVNYARERIALLKLRIIVGILQHLHCQEWEYIYKWDIL